MRLPRLVQDVFDFCYPGVCAGCRGPCEPSEFLCGPCLGRLVQLESAAACQRCGAPLVQTDAPCPFCKGDGVPHYSRILRLGVFDDPLKDLIHQFKYQGRWAIGQQLARRLLEQPVIRELLPQVDVLVPVPLHFLRQLHRGYNQATVIARCLARYSGTPLKRPLARIRNTETQTHLHSRAQRFDNLRSAFRLIRPRSIRGKRVLVIDDVLTTGATLQTVGRALRPARPSSLTALVLAVADPRGRGFRAV